MRGVFLDWKSLDRNDLDKTVIEQGLDELELFPETSPEQAGARIAGADVVISNKVVLDAQILQQAKKLKLICVAATGYNNIDLDTARSLGIVVCNVRAYATPSVAQHVFMLLLNLYRSFSSYQQAVQSGQWSNSHQFCLLDFPINELSGKTIGIIGYGELGQAVARLAEAFGMSVLIAKRNSEDTRPDRTELSVLLAQADVITLHCPLTESNQDMISKKELALMKPEAVLINAARGGLVNEQALADALIQKQIAAAAVDVLSKEPPDKDNPLLTLNMPNLIVTPHIAWASRESRQRMVEMIADNINAYSTGTPVNQL
ncbi:MAG: 2-hydroxyacid dehydrogenase [Gammaproteobacteria bacterium]|nr:2-hydroxyacid dehydrogenase [Gammaproteobacteria bacterium]